MSNSNDSPAACEISEHAAAATFLRERVGATWILACHDCMLSVADVLDGTTQQDEYEHPAKERDQLREFLFIWGEARQTIDEARCSETETGACGSFRPELFDYCDECSRASSAWDALQGIERVMLEAYEKLRESGYER